MELDWGRGTLVVSLASNDVQLARAAKEGGADALKVHVNVYHKASGNRFGSLEEEGERIREIVGVGLPVGIVPGEERFISRSEAKELGRLGIAFVDVYLSWLRLYLFDSGLPVIPAVDAETPPQVWKGVRHLPGEWLEAAVVPKASYGTEPEAEDLARLAAVGKATRRKLLVPSQRRVEPSDLRHYFRVPWVHAVMIGAIVTGHTPDGVYEATAAFRKALDDLRARGWV